MKKLAAIVGLGCDLAYGVLMVAAGAGLIVGGVTGVLWL